MGGCMDHKLYKKLKDNLGMKNPDIWCSYFNIARDTDKSYSSGRLPVPEKLALNIENLSKTRQFRVIKLVDKISSVFPTSNVSLCEITNDITLDIQSIDRKVIFKNNGKDHFSNDVYSFIGPGKINHLILYYPEKPWVKDTSKTNFDWFYWNYNDSVMHQGNYVITEDLLKPLLLPKT